MDSIKEFDRALEKAFELGKERHPDAPQEHHAAFANLVAYAMTANSGGYGGPSMRENLGARLIVAKFGTGAGRCTFEQAVELVEECCYGKLTLEHAQMLEQEYCFDAPGEVEVARKLLATASSS